MVIPCFEGAATLGRALDSIERQTRRPDEVIVVDDCSPESEQIRSAVRGREGIRYVRNARNLGLAGARNRGLAEANAGIVTFMDADDEAHPQRIEWQLRFLEDNVAVACDVLRVRAGSEPEHFRYDYADVDVFDHVGMMIYANRLTGASLMATRALLRKMGGYDESLRSCEDYDLWLRLLARGTEVRRIRLPLYIYHDNPAGLSKRYADIARHELAVIGKMIGTGRFGRPDSWHPALIWSVWLLRHLARARSGADPLLASQARDNVARLLGPAWPGLAAFVHSAGTSGLLRLFFRQA